ncbi:hypothetical protein D9619_004407 [Psilocybe cf. subviscida]|uniref:Zn(2)-C6 fungal-type domain-containing protein n=1 Tax=Psilocybe cf. subviscida TaxID=2480587 RepID=A0A8H5BQS8_9AGAR|nr:hypothetical protein D9619_004407 [Psilocybe cf. subviscida]
MPPVASPKVSRAAEKTPAPSKQKGAVRAKSGCYTCRIRRKKCDYNRFGAKLPEWLGENTQVSATREKIKAYLAAQGMIKGHAGSGSRSTIQEDILKLSEYPLNDDMGPYHRGRGSGSSSEGSPGRDDSIESDRHYRLQPNTSDMRGVPFEYQPRGRYERYYDHQDVHARSDSPHGGSSMQDYEYAGDYPMNTDPTVEPYPSSAVQSSFSAWYHTLPSGLLPMDELPEPTWTPGMVPHAYPSQIVSSQIISDATRNYVLNIVQIQYPLGNRKSLPDMIWKAINAHSESRDAVALLSKGYYGRQQDPSFSVLADADTLERIQAIGSSLSSRARFSADDAMAALHIVSLYLFDGGRGKWNQFLSFAAQYVRDVLEAPRHRGNYPQALEHATPKDQFVVKTTIWFDVLASITTQEPPKLIEYIRELFKPNLSYVGEAYTYSMLDPMGCENDVVWALAETSCLSYWKRRHERTGDLSIRELLIKASEIDEHLAAGPRPFPPQPDEDSWRRFLASEIFRTSAKLFLKSVESGDHPYLREVCACVDECYEAITRYPSAETPSARSTIVRSTVFGVFICGALTDDTTKQNVLRTHLMQNSGQEGVGNANVMLEILEKIWCTNPRQGRNVAVQWRQYLGHYEVLLV